MIMIMIMIIRMIIISTSNKSLRITTVGMHAVLNVPSPPKFSEFDPQTDPTVFPKSSPNCAKLGPKRGQESSGGPKCKNNKRAPLSSSRASWERFKIGPGCLKGALRRPKKPPRAALSIPVWVSKGFKILSKSPSTNFQNLRARLHGSVIFDSRGARGSRQSRRSRSS